MNHSLQRYETPQDVYARHLSSRRGYPLWMPEVKAELPRDYQDHGLKIGDVGYVVPEQGCFEVLFNITLPQDHDLHRDRPLPRNFQPLALNEALDIASYPGAEVAGNVIKSTSVTTVEVGPEEKSPDYKFTFSSGEGALLILPHGADQRSLHRYQQFGLYAMRHAVEWYRFVEEDLGRVISSNSLYLITGFYKSRSWALAAFEKAGDPTNVSAQFRITQREGKTLAQGYRWTTTRRSESRVGPELYTGKTNQAVYIRGFKIAVRPEPLGRKQIMVRADHPSVETRWEEFSEVIDVQDPDETQGDAPGNSAHTSDGSSKGKGTTRTIKHVSVRSVPQVSDPFHPSDIINKYLLQKVPSATVAITHDSQWAALLKSAQGELDAWELANEHLVVEALSKKYGVVLKDGAVFLQGAVDINDTLNVEDHAGEVARTKQKDGDVFIQSAVDATDALDVHGNLKEEPFAGIQRRLSMKMPDITVPGLGLRRRNTLGKSQAPLTLKGHEPRSSVALVAFVSEDHIISVSEQDRTIRQWICSESRWRNDVLKEATAVCGSATSPDCRLVAYGGADGRVRLIDLQEGRVLKSDDRHEDMVQSVSFSPDSNQLASGARDGTVLLWSLNPLQPAAEPSKRHSDSVWCIRYSPDGRKIASCDRQVIQIRDFTTRVKSRITEQAWSLAWSMSSERCFLLAGCIDGTLRRFDPDTGETLTICKAHQDVISSIALPRNANFIATASWDKTVRFWEATTFQEIASCLQHDVNVHSISISPSDEYLVSGARDPVVRVWNLKAIAPTLFRSTSQQPIRLSPQKAAFLLPFQRQVHFADPSPTSPHPGPSDGNNRTAPKDSQESLQKSDGESAQNKGPLKPRPGIQHPLKKKSEPNSPRPSSSSSQESIPPDGVPAEDRSSPSLHHSTEQSNFLSPAGHSWNPASTQLPTPTSRGNGCGSSDFIRKIRSYPSDLTGKIIPEGSDPVSGGSHGDVYRGMLNFDGSTMRVAIKVIKKYTAQGNDESKERRLRREINLWRTLEHRNIVPLLGTSTDYGAFEAMVCPWVENGALAPYLENHRLELTDQQRLAIINDIALGLQYLHSLRIVHGDISGTNILIDASGRARIADFGLSIILAGLEGSSMALTYQLKGTLRYTAPELLFGILEPNRDSDSTNSVPSEDARKVFPTIQSDIYSFGGIMLQTLTGKIPYYHIADGTVILAISKGEYPKRPASCFVTDDQWKFMIRCWAAKPMNRPSDANIVMFVHEQLLDAVAYCDSSSRRSLHGTGKSDESCLT